MIDAQDTEKVNRVSKIDIKVDREKYCKKLYNDYCLKDLSCGGRILSEASIVNMILPEDWRHLTIEEKI